MNEINYTHEAITMVATALRDRDGVALADVQDWAEALSPSDEDREPLLSLVEQAWEVVENG